MKCSTESPSIINSDHTDIVRLLFFTLTLISLFCSSTSYASLLISPIRVSIPEDSHSEEIYIINSSKELKNYTIDWKPLVAQPNGGYRDLNEKEKSNYVGLERVVRISPKRVTLAPGQRQVIKLLVRKQKSMPQGEYRSHLSFTALPNKAKISENSKNSFSFSALISYTMPVIYRVGSVVVNPEITDISLVHKKQTGITNIKVDLYHNDLFSTHGRFIAYWIPVNGQTRQVGLLNGYNFYPELKNASTQFPWKGFKLEPGTLEVRYEGQAEFSGLLLAQKSLTITQQMINSIK